jgi:hypothetical protein
MAIGGNSKRRGQLPEDTTAEKLIGHLAHELARLETRVKKLETRRGIETELIPQPGARR